MVLLGRCWTSYYAPKTVCRSWEGISCWKGAKTGPTRIARVAVRRVHDAHMSSQVIPEDIPLEEVTPLHPPVLRKKQVGALQRLPVIPQPLEMLNSALKRARKVPYSQTIKNETKKEVNRITRQLDTLKASLSSPLTRFLEDFPDPQRLHPFDQALLNLTVGEKAYLGVLKKVAAVRNGIHETGSSICNQAAKMTRRSECGPMQEEGFQRLTSVFTKGEQPLNALRDMCKQLRALPYVDPEVPTVVLVGAPNVGKSSLVQILSSGKPEICNYPFTTRSVKLGHFYLDGRKHQVTDTPGLLNRPDEDRNKMELLTLAAVAHLPTHVLFVIDLTEECGTKVKDQWEIRERLRRQFSEKTWLDVFSKADMLADVFAMADRGQTRVEGRGEGTGAAASVSGVRESITPELMGRFGSGPQPGGLDQGDGSLTASTSHSGGGSSALVTSQNQTLHGRHDLAGPEHSGSTSCMSPTESGQVSSQCDGQLGTYAATPSTSPLATVSSAVEFVQRLPHAVRVSAITEDGIETLKVEVIRVLSSDSNCDVEADI